MKPAGSPFVLRWMGAPSSYRYVDYIVYKTLRALWLMYRVKHCRRKIYICIDNKSGRSTNVFYLNILVFRSLPWLLFQCLKLG